MSYESIFWPLQGRQVSGALLLARCHERDQPEKCNRRDDGGSLRTGSPSKLNTENDGLQRKPEGLMNPS